MEESEKRRERLKAMRMEAEAEVVGSESCSSLSNPLLERPEDDAVASAAPRFGFYTDPMAAFDKRQPQPRPRFPHSPSPSRPKNPEMPVSGVHQFHYSYSPYQSTQQPGDPYYPPRPSPSPMGMQSPYPPHQGRPNFSSAPGRGQWYSNSPSPGPGRGGHPYPMYQGNPNFRGPPQGRGHWSNHSPGPSFRRGGGHSPDMGRGRGQWGGNRMSPGGARYSGGRGRGPGFNNHSPSLYDKSMVEDPWESLTPVIWQGSGASGSFLSNRWGSFKSTPSAKKPRASGTVDTSNSNQSLAEFLAASFDEAAGDSTAE